VRAHAQPAPAHAQVHLYDVDLSEQGGPVLQESRGTAPGHEVRRARPLCAAVHTLLSSCPGQWTGWPGAHGAHAQALINLMGDCTLHFALCT